MVKIEQLDKLDADYSEYVRTQFEMYASQKNIRGDYTDFAFAAKENNETAGIITGHICYDEAHVSELIVDEKYRGMKIGSSLLAFVERYCKDRGIERITLTTYEFQAPIFYLKIGFSIEFIRRSKLNPRLDKYFLIKSIG